MLQETKEVLEDQLEGWRARSDKVHQLEKHGLLLKARMHDMEQVEPSRTNKNKFLICSHWQGSIHLFFFSSCFVTNAAGEGGGPETY